MSANKSTPPFSKEYVIGVTTRHMRRAVETSITKTLDRMAEFNRDNNAEKSLEAFETLTQLQAMKNGLLHKQQ